MNERTGVLYLLQRLRYAFEQSRASRTAEHLARQLSSLSDPVLRLHSFGQKLREMSAMRISLGLLPHLLRQDLVEISQYESLPPAVREKASRLARKRELAATLSLRGGD